MRCDRRAPARPLARSLACVLRIIWLVQMTPFIPPAQMAYTPVLRSCLVLAVPCSALFFPPDRRRCGKIPTFISATGPSARDTRPTSSPYAQVPAFTICPVDAHTHKGNDARAHTHWHERHILTSSCSRLDQQKGSHMQSERGLWGQGAASWNRATS